MEDWRIALPIGVALDRFIKRNQEDFPFATGELSQLLRDVALASKVVNREMNKAGLVNLSGAIGEQNVQGEDQQKLDVLANIRFKRALMKGGEACAVISEEDEEIVGLESTGHYIVAIDPLDGSSNIDVNVSVGTIFSIYRRLSPVGGPIQLEDVLQKGDKQVASGYILYGSSTMLVYTTGSGVNGFTYDPSLGEYFLSHPDMKYQKDGSVYSINEGLIKDFSEGIRDYLDACHQKRYTARYIGSLVADFHRNLLKGGIYLYPSTKSKPDGKLRLMFECNALAFIAEQAEGTAVDEKNGRIMDIEPESIHQRSSFVTGSSGMVEEAISYQTDTSS